MFVFTEAFHAFAAQGKVPNLAPESLQSYGAGGCNSQKAMRDWNYQQSRIQNMFE
jgi:hypothetical protein